MSKVLHLVFKTDTDKNFTLRVNAPKENLSRAQVESVMSAIIAKPVFEVGGATLAGIADIYTIARTKQEILV